MEINSYYYVELRFKKFVLGYGSNYPNIVGSISGYYISAHNIFFGHLIQNGIIGCICLISLFVNSIKKSIEILKLMI